jgi:hypothetical protein
MVVAFVDSNYKASNDQNFFLNVLFQLEYDGNTTSYFLVVVDFCAKRFGSESSWS